MRGRVWQPLAGVVMMAVLCLGVLVAAALPVAKVKLHMRPPDC